VTRKPSFTALQLFEIQKFCTIGYPANLGRLSEELSVAAPRAVGAVGFPRKPVLRRVGRGHHVRRILAAVVRGGTVAAHGGGARHHLVLMQRGEIVLGRAGRMVAARLSGQRGQGPGQGNGRQDFRRDRHFRESFWIGAQTSLRSQLHLKY